jgi:hypothetical protein
LAALLAGLTVVRVLLPSLRIGLPWFAALTAPTRVGPSAHG